MLGTTKVPMPTDQNTWHCCEVVKDSFWYVVSKLTMGTTAPFEGDKEVYPTTTIVRLRVFSSARGPY